MDPYTLRLRGRLWFFGHTHGQTLRQFVGHLQQLGHFRCRRSEEHTSELQSLRHLVCRLLLEKKKKKKKRYRTTRDKPRTTHRSRGDNTRIMSRRPNTISRPLQQHTNGPTTQRATTRGRDSH